MGSRQSWRRTRSSARELCLKFFLFLSCLPAGLDHVKDMVSNWDAAVRTLSFTAAAIAESVGTSEAASAVGASPWESELSGQQQQGKSLLFHLLV